MSNIKKLMMSAAGGGGLNVEDVFSTYVYDGTGTTKIISNGIDLDTEGGMTWFKRRNGTSDHQLFDSERGGRYRIESNTGASQADEGGTVWSTRTDGFSIGGDGGAQIYNSSTDEYVSWTFRKASGFFDVVSYTGNGTAGRTVSHNLGSVPGCIIVKSLNDYSDWPVYHKGTHASTPEDYRLRLNSNVAIVPSAPEWNSTAPTATNFTLSNSGDVNANGKNYIAYIFASHDGDGTFGETGDQDIIRCDKVPASTATDVDLGYEPQWIMIKRTDSGGDWQIYDNIRGMFVRSHDPRRLYANQSNAEENGNSDYLYPKPNGFHINTNYFGGGPYVYIAIRRGPMATPTDVDDVFAIDTRGGTSPTPPELYSGFVTDWLLYPNNTNTSNDKRVIDRLRGKRFIYTNKRDVESNVVGEWDYMNGHGEYTNVDSNDIGFMWKRAPGFFDIVTWNVDGTGNTTIPHNLGVVPEMVWSKNRNDSGYGSGSWWIAHNGLTGWDSSNENDRHVFQDFGTGPSSQQGYHRDFTDTSIRLTSNGAGGYNTSHKCIAYLFATLPGISKVGSFTHTYNTAQNIDCGFTNGISFLLLKRYDGNGSWRMYNSLSGITSGNDAMLDLGDTSAIDNSANQIDLYSGGFAMRANYLAGGDYIFYAIAA